MSSRIGGFIFVAIIALLVLLLVGIATNEQLHSDQACPCVVSDVIEVFSMPPAIVERDSTQVEAIEIIAPVDNQELNELMVPPVLDPKR